MQRPTSTTRNKHQAQKQRPQDGPGRPKNPKSYQPPRQKKRPRRGNKEGGGIQKQQTEPEKPGRGRAEPKRKGRQAQKEGKRIKNQIRRKTTEAPGKTESPSHTKPKKGQRQGGKPQPEPQPKQPGQAII